MTVIIRTDTRTGERRVVNSRELSRREAESRIARHWAPGMVLAHFVYTVEVAA